MGSPLQSLMSLFQPARPKPGPRLTPSGELDIASILRGSEIKPMQKSPYERTMRPGETRSAGDLQDMLAEVTLRLAGLWFLGWGREGWRGKFRALD
jgi:hypothetical protein